MLVGHTLDKIDGHLGMDQAPILPSPSPLFRNIHHGQIEHFQQAIIGRKHRFGLGNLTQLAVKALNCVGGIDQSSYGIRILEIRTQICPVVPPGLRNFRVFLSS